MATQKKIIGKLPVFRGEYNKSVVYYKHNIVTYLGSSFISTKDENMSVPCSVGDKKFILSSGWAFFSDSSEAYFMDERFDEMAEVVVTTDDEGEVNNVEPDVVNEAIRKTPQILSKAEQKQARANISAASVEENAEFLDGVEGAIAEIDAKVSDIGQEVSNLDTLVYGKVLSFKGQSNGTSWFACKFVKGKKYTFKNTSLEACDINLNTTIDDVNYTQIVARTLAVGNSVTVTIEHDGINYVGGYCVTPLCLEVKCADDVDSRLSKTEASISNINEELQGLEEQRTLMNGKWLTIHPESHVFKNNNEVSGLEKLEIINKMDSMIESIESVFFKDGGCSFSLFTLNKDSIIIGIYFYDNKRIEYTQSDFSSNNKFLTIVSDLEELKENGYTLFINQRYSPKSIKIQFNKSIIDYCDSLTSENSVSYEARNVNTIYYPFDGIRTKDVTNKLFLVTPPFSIYKEAENAFNTNNGIVSFDGSESKMYTLANIAYRNNTIEIKIASAEKSNRNFESAKILVGKINIDGKGIVRVPCTDYYKTEIVYITIDVDCIKKITQQGFTINDAENLFALKEDYVCIDMEHAYSGYFTPSGLVDDAGYSTCVIPINKECDIMEIYGIFDKKANIALAKESGAVWDWGLKNADGTKYSEDGDITFARVSCKGYKFVAVSTRHTDIESLVINARNYDEETAIDSFSSLKHSLVKDKRLPIQMFDACINKNKNVLIDTDRSIVMVDKLQFEDIPNSYITTQAGLVYKTSALLEVGHYTKNKYYCGVQRNDNSNAPLLWKEDENGNQSQILKGGDTPPIVSDYTNLSGWIWSRQYAMDNVADTAFIKELDDSELLIGITLSNLATNETKYVIFKTANNQSVWVPKIITSCEHYQYDGAYYSSYGYPTKNNSIHKDYFYDRKMILISEYGNGTPKYWKEKGVAKNGNGVSGKVWFSIDNGNTFFKIFDFDEKINKNPNDTSVGNWKWCKSYEGRMSIHIHGCYIDKINEKIWVTNGDSATVDGVNLLLYIDILTLILDILNNKIQPVDASDLMPKYSGEYLPDFNSMVLQEYNHNGNEPYSNVITKRATYQSYCMFPNNKVLILGNDTARQLIYGIHRNTIYKGSNNKCDGMFLDIFQELDKNNPSMTIQTFPQCIFRRDENSPILMLWHYEKGIWASWDGIEWVNVGNKKNMVGFISYYVKDLDGKYIIVNTEVQDSDLSGINYINTKITNY